MRVKSSTILASTLVCVILGASVGGWLLWEKNQALADDNAQLQSDLTALRNDVHNASGSGSGNVLGDTSSGGSNSSPAANDASKKTLLVKDFGIKFTVPDNLADLTYAESPPASGYLQLTTQALASQYHDCAPAGILGALFRYPKNQPLPATPAATHAQKLSAAGSYQYYYMPLETNPCPTNKPAATAVSAATASLREALKSLSEQ